MSTQMTFAQSYMLASKVRSKLTREAANPRASLRNLVVQANMLDNLMDHIAEELSRRKEMPKETQRETQRETPREATKESNLSKESYHDSQSNLSKSYNVDYSESHVRFELPQRGAEEYEQSDAPSVSVIEYDSDSDSEYESDEDEDYYYSDEEEERAVPIYKHLPTMNLSVISEEEEAEQGVPELSRALSDDESDEDFHSYTYTPVENIMDVDRAKETHVGSLFDPMRVHHERTNAVLY